MASEQSARSSLANSQGKNNRLCRSFLAFLKAKKRSLEGARERSIVPAPQSLTHFTSQPASVRSAAEAGESLPGSIFRLEDTATSPGAVSSMLRLPAFNVLDQSLPG